MEVIYRVVLSFILPSSKFRKTDMSNNQDKITTNTGQLATPGDKDELPILGPVIPEPYPADRPTEDDRPVESGTTHPAWTDSGSTTSTPGHPFPGSYPGPIDSKEETKAVKEVTATTLETAKEYVASARETVSGYFPESVAAYLREFCSLLTGIDS
jgi:hypothetical protein